MLFLAKIKKEGNDGLSYLYFLRDPHASISEPPAHEDEFIQTRADIERSRRKYFSEHGLPMIYRIEVDFESKSKYEGQPEDLVQPSEREKTGQMLENLRNVKSKQAFNRIMHANP